MNQPDEAILDALYQGAFDITAFERAVGLIANRFGCRSGAMVSIDMQAPATGAITPGQRGLAIVVGSRNPCSGGLGDPTGGAGCVTPIAWSCAGRG